VSVFDKYRNLKFEYWNFEHENCEFFYFEFLKIVFSNARQVYFAGQVGFNSSKSRCTERMRILC
jgi:hypothetical protein